MPPEHDLIDWHDEERPDDAAWPGVILIGIVAIIIFGLGFAAGWQTHQPPQDPDPIIVKLMAND